MPNQPRPDNLGHTIRFEADTWAAVVALAAEDGVRPSVVVREAVAAYVARRTS